MEEAKPHQDYTSLTFFFRGDKLIASTFKGLLPVRVPDTWAKDGKMKIGVADGKAILIHDADVWALWVTQNGVDVHQHKEKLESIPPSFKEGSGMIWEPYSNIHLFGISSNIVSIP